MRFNTYETGRGGRMGRRLTSLLLPRAVDLESVRAERGAVRVAGEVDAVGDVAADGVLGLDVDRAVVEDGGRPGRVEVVGGRRVRGDLLNPLERPDAFELLAPE